MAEAAVESEEKLCSKQVGVDEEPISAIEEPEEDKVAEAEEPEMAEKIEAYVKPTLTKTIVKKSKYGAGPKKLNSGKPATPIEENDYNNSENKDSKVLANKKEIMNSILLAKDEIIKQMNRTNSDKKHINLLHTYNYLKDGTFKLVEALSNIKQCSAKEINAEFEIKDLE